MFTIIFCEFWWEALSPETTPNREDGAIFLNIGH